MSAFELVADMPWAPRAVTMRVLDADGREVHSAIKGEVRGSDIEPSGMVLVHRTYDRWQRAAPPSGSVAHDRAVDPRNFGVRRVMIRAPNQTSEIVSLGVFKG